jgi:iron complex transport system substrate-binding protein
MELAGASNAFADVKRESVQATTELLLARAPAVILEMRRPTSTAAQLSAERLVWNGLPGIPAVKTGRIHLLTEEALAIPGPRVVIAARTLATAIHGDRSTIN